MAALFRLSVLLVLLLATGAFAAAAPPSIEVFAGSASRPATEELARRFEQATGTRVLVHFGGSGALLSQMEETPFTPAASRSRRA
ncbi:MAG: substrate-binding domain-containing protein [Deferrisomatales bacterium]